MTRRLSQLLIMTLALQFSWSVVSAYCMHETGRAAEHFGHHQHKSEVHDPLASADLDHPAASKKASGAHSHCASCSHAVSVPVAVGESVWRAARVGARPANQEPSFSSRVLAPPERPQWRSIA